MQHFLVSLNPFVLTYFVVKSRNFFIFLSFHICKEGGPSVITDFQGPLRLQYAQKNDN